MTLPKLPVLTFLAYSLLACNQTSKQSDNSNKIDSSKIDTTKAIAVFDSTTSTKKEENSVYNEGIEDKIIDTIFKLPEIKELAKYIEVHTKNKRHLKVWIADTPNLPDQKYYWIKVGEDNGTNLVTHFNFFVYPDSMRIMYYDTSADSELPLDEWRKKQKGM